MIDIKPDWKFWVRYVIVIIPCFIVAFPSYFMKKEKANLELNFKKTLEKAL